MAKTPDPAARWVRVRDKDTGHEYDVAPAAFRDDAHVLVSSNAYPDLFGDAAQARPHRTRTDKAGQPVANQTQES